MTARANASHIGGALSAADILGVLYGNVMRFDSTRPDWPDRDRFILSKGHACTALYAALAETGYFPIEKLDTFYSDGSPLAGHATHKDMPGVEVSTGSLGHGLPLATGMALASRRDGRDDRVYCLVSDGECNEGSTWEPALFAPHHRLDNLVVVVDYNKIQSLGRVEEVIELDPLADKWRAFGWATEELDGHDTRRSSPCSNDCLSSRGSRLRRRTHRQGQGRELHGGSAPLALPSATRGAHGSGARGDRSAR